MQLLSVKGWIMYYACNCGGSRKEHWAHNLFPGYEIRYRPKRKTFEIKSKNIRVFGPDIESKLEVTLKQFGLWIE